MNSSIHITTSSTLIIGIFKYNRRMIDPGLLKHEWAMWKARINAGEHHETFRHLDQNYYDSYLTNMFPEVRKEEMIQGEYDPSLLYHFTKKLLIGESLSYSLNLNTTVFEGTIPYLDIYLFPNEIGLFTLKFEMDVPTPALNDLSLFIKTVRQPESSIEIGGESINLKTFIEKNILTNLAVDEHWNRYNPQFKTYTNIDLTEEMDQTRIDKMLFDLGTVSEPGTAAGEGLFAPSAEYFDKLMKENRITVFRNWTALCLFDTFTRISINLPDQHKVWEYDYFHIYLHAIYMKSFMYLTNTELSDVTKATRETATIRDKFVEFINDYYLSHISYKFLPNLLYDKMLAALEISREVEMMEKKIQRINESFQKKREVTLNTALTIIIFLSLFSVITDLSSWLEELGLSHGWIYPYLSITILLIISAGLISIFISKIRK